MSLKNITALMLAVSLCSVTILADEIDAESRTDLAIDADALPIELSGFEGEVRGLWRDGRVFIAGQPDEAAFARFSEIGVTAVINLRTPTEVNDRDRVPFDEAAVVGSLRMEYIHIPLGGEDHPYSPEAVGRFADALTRHDGLVLLHCTVGWRASYMWGAYLVNEQDFDLDAAMARAEAMAVGDLPIEGLLGRPLKLAYVD